jgi:hypothetical protein
MRSILQVGAHADDHAGSTVIRRSGVSLRRVAPLAADASLRWHDGMERSPRFVHQVAHPAHRVSSPTKIASPIR